MDTVVAFSYDALGTGEMISSFSKQSHIDDKQPDRAAVSFHWNNSRSGFVNQTRRWNVSYSLSPESHLLVCQNLTENPLSLFFSFKYTHTLAAIKSLIFFNHKRGSSS